MKCKLTKQTKMKLLNFKHEKHYLSAEDAQNILRFGYRNVTIQDALAKEISDLETMIKSKSGLGCRIMSVSYSDTKTDLVERLADHFKERGFVVDIYENPNIKGFILLIIGW